MMKISDLKQLTYWQNSKGSKDFSAKVHLLKVGDQWIALDDDALRDEIYNEDEDGNMRIGVRFVDEEYAALLHSTQEDAVQASNQRYKEWVTSELERLRSEQEMLRLCS